MICTEHIIIKTTNLEEGPIRTHLDAAKWYCLQFGLNWMAAIFINSRAQVFIYHGDSIMNVVCSRPTEEDRIKRFYFNDVENADVWRVRL